MFCKIFKIRNEAVCHRSLNGVRLHEGIQILAALNPYRLKPETQAVVEAGLALPTAEKSTNRGDRSREAEINLLHDPQMSKLVYKVHMIPSTMQVYNLFALKYCFYFGFHVFYLHFFKIY